ncbi:SERTA domain-containing protein 3 [Brachyhypopomus gauderio]|uniref:SERTA domain-containing protein 3 n=1 Tax=Brachyhypopomus gauderio TaxID=698409 RepID=UPI00404128FE
MMVARGMKRKVYGSDDGGGSVWESQLQSVLDISLDKFQRDQALVEPSLLRSVLITNTLRQVQSEVKTQLSGISSHPNLHTQPKEQPGLLSQLGSIPVGHNASRCSLGDEDMEDDLTAWTSEKDLSLATAITAILNDLDAALDSDCEPSVPQRLPLASMENLPGDARFKQNSTISHQIDTSKASIVGASSSMSDYLHETVIDDLLLDIDTSVFEAEANVLSPCSFPFPPEQLVKYLPPLSNSSAINLTPASPPHGQMTQDMHELEHIMNILVHF